jgi:hypothetical protein
LGRLGSKGRIFSHWASVSCRPYRAIGPPLALLPAVISYFRQLKNHQFNPLYPVLKQLLVILLPAALPVYLLSDLVYRHAPHAEPIVFWTLTAGFNFLWYWLLSFIVIKVRRYFE